MNGALFVRTDFAGDWQSPVNVFETHPRLKRGGTVIFDDGVDTGMSSVIDSH